MTSILQFVGQAWAWILVSFVVFLLFHLLTVAERRYERLSATVYFRILRISRLAVLPVFFGLLIFHLSQIEQPVSALSRSNDVYKFDEYRDQMSWEVPVANSPVDQQRMLDQAVTSVIGQTHTLFDSALVRIGMGEFDSAITMLDTLIARGTPDSVLKSDWLYFRGLACQFGGNTPAALEDFNAVLKLKPDYAEAWLNRSIALLDLGRNVEAEASMRTAESIAARPGIRDYFIGMYYYRLEEYARALAYFQAAIEDSSQYVLAWFGKGMVHSTIGRHYDAIASLNTALEFRKGFPEAWSFRGLSHARRGETDSALASLDSSFLYGKDIGMALVTNAGAFIELGRYRAAIACVDRALTLGRNNPQGWYYKGVALGKVDSTRAEALSALETALTYRPSFPEARIERAVLNYLEGDSIQFLSDLEIAYDLEASRSRLSAMLRRGEAFSRIGQHDSAIVAYNEALKHGSEHPELTLNLALRFQEENAPDRALEALQFALEYEKDWPEALELLSMIDSV
ncbi:MAG: tetratricopeptide repeat protein, partial [candidate division Zixibacteria bacterium]|nr:tetratricopeptide repeat protein [candidate division Zixibacteria bacterium]